jgi:hypothetical protein
MMTLSETPGRWRGEGWSSSAACLLHEFGLEPAHIGKAH